MFPKPGPYDLEEEYKELKRRFPKPPVEPPLYPWLRQALRFIRRVGSVTQGDWDRLALVGINKRDVVAVVLSTVPRRLSKKQKWKYGRVLKRAVQEGITPFGLPKFMKQYGGINGCVSRRPKATTATEKKKSAKDNW